MFPKITDDLPLDPHEFSKFVKKWIRDWSVSEETGLADENTLGVITNIRLADDVYNAYVNGVIGKKHFFLKRLYAIVGMVFESDSMNKWNGELNKLVSAAKKSGDPLLVEFANRTENLMNGKEKFDSELW